MLYLLARAPTCQPNQKNCSSATHSDDCNVRHIDSPLKDPILLLRTSGSRAARTSLLRSTSGSRGEVTMTGFLLRVAIVALGLWLATQILPGLHFDSAGTLLAAALLLGIVNAIVRPIAVVLTLPLTLLTLGLFLLVDQRGDARPGRAAAVAAFRSAASGPPSARR